MAAVESAVGTALYAYGIVAAGHSVADDALDVVPVGDLAAIVRRVPRERFERSATTPRAERWLEEQVRTHDRVLRALVADTAVVPLRFGALFSGEDAVAAMIAREADGLRALLRRLEGRVEAGVKLRLLAPAGTTPAPRSAEAAPAGPGGSGPGARWLDRRRRERLARVRWQVGIRVAAERVVDALQDEGAGLARLRASETDVVLHLAALIDRDRFEAVVDGLGGLAGESPTTVEVTGPWPAYSFVPAELGR